jgi:ribosomal-protein-alanine N-acetyltransferase
VKDVGIFRAQFADIPDMQKIEIACELSPWTSAGYESELTRTDSAAFVARSDDGQAVGFLIGRISPAKSGVAEIYNIGTLSQFRRLGIGKSLVDEFIAACRNMRVSHIWLEVRSSNRDAISFYSRNLFELSGLRRNFYENPREDAQLMTLRLNR